MKDQLLEILQSQGPLTIGQIIEITKAELYKIEVELRDLRVEGKVRVDQCVTPKWYYDCDFQCKTCKKCFPEVRRSGNTKRCSFCAYDLYKNPNAKPKGTLKPIDHSAPGSRFCQSEIGTTWAGVRSQEILVKLRLRA